MNVFELFGTIAIDNSGAERSLDRTVGHARDAESKLERAFKNIGKVIAAAFAADKIKDFGKSCTEAYASIAAEESAFAQIMGDYADTAQRKLEAVSDATGVSSTRMTTHMTSLTAKFKGLGYNVEDATTLASDGLLIAADAAAFWDMSLDESMSHLNSFINGSYEGGEAIGLFANDTQMAAYAVEQGIVADAKAWAALDEATKQATRLDYAKKMMESSGATGQAAKEAGAYANVMAEVKEAWRQLQGVIGKPILEKLVLPAMQKLIAIMPGLTEAVQIGIDWLLEAFDKVASYFGEVFTEDGLNMDALPAAFEKMFRDLGRAIPGLLLSVGNAIKSAWRHMLWPAIQGFFKATLGIDLPEWSDIEKKITDWWDGGNGIKKEIANVCNWVLNLFGAPADVTAEDVSNVLDSWWTSTKKFVQDTCTWVLKLFDNPEAAMNDVQDKIGEWWKTASGWVASACNWALNLFGAPADVTAEDVSLVLGSWWTSTKKFVQDACTWVLKLFNNPEAAMNDVQDKIGEWWKTARGWVESACEWVLNLFGVPQAKADAVRNLVSGWWIGMKDAAQSATQWTLQLFQNPKETMKDVQSKIGEWWKTARAWVQNACVWTLQLFGFEQGAAIKAVAKIVAWFDNVKRVTKSALKLAYDWVSGKDKDTIASEAETLFGEVKDSLSGALQFVWQLVPPETQETILGLIESLQTFWNENKEGITEIFDLKNGLLATFLTGISDLLSDPEFGASITSAISAFLGAIKTIADALFTEEGKDTIAALLDLLVSVLHLIQPVLSLIQPVLSALETPIKLVASVIEAIANFLAILAGDEEYEKGVEEQKGQDNDRSKYGGYQYVTDALATLSRASVNKSVYTEQEKYIEGKAGTLAGVSEDVIEAMEALWEDYRAAKRDGNPYEQNSAEDDHVDEVWDALYANFLEQGLDDGDAGRKANLMLDQLITNMTYLSHDLENLPKEWFENGGSGGGGGNSGMVNGLYKRGSTLPADYITQSNGILAALMNVLTANNEAQAAATREAVIAGLAGVTIEGNITTGDVRLNEGTLVGALFPKIDLKLGWATGMQGRG